MHALVGAGWRGERDVIVTLRNVVRAVGQAVVCLAASVILRGGPDVWDQPPADPVHYGLPRLRDDSVAARWQQRRWHAYLCRVGPVVTDPSVGSYVQVDSPRVADQPWATCNDPPVMG